MNEQETNLQKLITMAKEFIQHSFSETDENDNQMIPMFIAMGPDGMVKFFGIEFRDESDKDAVAWMMREKFKEEETVAYVFFSEAWQTKILTPKESRTVSPSEALDREEIVALIGQDKEGNSVLINFDINRNNGKRFLGTCKEQRGETVGGRFAHLLKQQERTIN